MYFFKDLREFLLLSFEFRLSILNFLLYLFEQYFLLILEEVHTCMQCILLIFYPHWSPNSFQIHTQAHMLISRPLFKIAIVTQSL